MGYGDYQIGNITISRVYYEEGLGHNLLFVGQFCNSDLEVAFRKHTCFVRNLEGVDVLSGSRETNLYRLSIGDMMASSPTCLLSKASKTKSWGNRTLVKAACTILIYTKAPLFLWAEAVAIACYTQKTPYELLHDRKPDLSYLHVFGALCYPNNDSEDLGKLQAKADIGVFIGYAPKQKDYRIYNRRTQKVIETIHINFNELTAMASEQLGSGPGLQFMTPATSSSGLVTNPIPQQPCNPPPRDDWDRLFQPMFDEYFNPPTINVSPGPVANAPRAGDLADSPVSTSIDQDAPLTSIPSTQVQEHSPIISQGSSSNMRPINTPLKSLGRWTKDHLIENIIGDPSRSIYMRKQLETDAMWFYFDAFLTFVEPKNFKQAMTEPSWIDAMQEEIHEFKRLQGFMQEEEIDFEESFAPVARIEAICAVDPTLFTWKAGNNLLLVQIYVDDITFASTNTALCNEFANMMTTKFKMSMMGQMLFFLGLQISQSPRGIFLNQSKYAYEIIKKYGFLTSDSVDTPMVEKNKMDEDLHGKQVDATLYRGMIGTRPYLCSLLTCPDIGMSLTAYSDVDHAGCQDTRHSTSGSAQFLGEKLVSWSSNKQKSTAISNYGFQFNKIPLYHDNKNAIALCCNNVQHSRAKHIDVRYHFIKEQVENGIVELYFVRTKYQLAGIFTKPLPQERFNFLIEKLSMRRMSPEKLKRLIEEEMSNGGNS
ncbi:retrovirus-related pol polyprotein from transposon TNT 1-94 [Tanacetum coccineum]